MSRTYVVTGAARGLGLEMVRQLADRGATVFASPRKRCRELDAIASGHEGRVRVVPMDVSDPDAVAAAARTVAEHTDSVDVLVNNAGVYPKGGGVRDGLDYDAMESAFRINTLGPLRVAETLLPLLRAGEGRKIAQVTSLMGSIADNSSGGSYAYRVSKTALNMATRNLAHELGSEGFVSMVLHPGWVRTDMGGGAAPLGIAPAVADILKTIEDADPAMNGRFVDREGHDLPW